MGGMELIYSLNVFLKNEEEIKERQRKGKERKEKGRKEGGRQKKGKKEEREREREGGKELYLCEGKPYGNIGKLNVVCLLCLLC